MFYLLIKYLPITLINKFLCYLLLYNLRKINRYKIIRIKTFILTNIVDNKLTVSLLTQKALYFMTQLLQAITTERTLRTHSAESSEVTNVVSYK